MGSDSILSFWGILQHGGVYILEHSVGRYSKGDAQPRRYCGKSTVDLDDSNTSLCSEINQTAQKIYHIIIPMSNYGAHHRVEKQILDTKTGLF